MSKRTKTTSPKKLLKPVEELPPLTKESPERTPGELIDVEIFRLTDDSEWKYNTIVDSHCVHLSIDLEHWSENFAIIAVHDCYGSVAKQLVAECERVAGVYQRFAQTIKDRIFQDWLETNGDK